jgi:ferredoxin-NADP reductase
MHSTHDEQHLALRVHRMTFEAEGVLSLELRYPDGRQLPVWEPGAHLDLLLPGVITRQYSLCGDPDDRFSWTIAVLREPVSKGGSAAVHGTVRPGQLVDVVGPRNHFPFQPATTCYFIAGGIGITPLIPMIKRAADAGVDWCLVYGGRSRTSMAFVQRLEALGPRVQIRPQDEYGLIDLSRLDTPTPDAQVYCCGPEPLLAAVEQRCRSWPTGSLHVERFKPSERSAGGGEQDREFTVVLATSSREITVPAGQSVLEALEAAGVEPPNSCREGICGTCETKVLAGQPDHRDSLLSDQERAENATMMICVGRALSERLVLEL